ncbi:MAG: T9SS type A sorting domain-containing protein [Candidatus Kapaibacterium sp.]
MRNYILFLIICSFLFATDSNAQVGKQQTLFVQTQYNKDGTVTLSWPKDEAFEGIYYIYENMSEFKQDYKYLGNVTNDADQWNDPTYTKGQIKEYKIEKKNTSNQIVSYDFITVGNEVDRNGFSGSILILVDDSHFKALSTELDILVSDLKGENWEVAIMPVSREMTPPQIKDLIKVSNESSKIGLTTLYLIGHVPVPYSGHFSTTGAAYPPDGHTEGSGNHTGAWPADLYYGDLDGMWTDATVTYEASTQERNNNRPGDGKFDQTRLISDIELEIGRVDFYDMPAFSDDELTLLKNYLDRAHQWKTGQLESIDRGLIDDNFKGYIIGNTGYKAMGTLIGTDSLFEDRDYMTSLREGKYILSFGMGGGSYSSCGGVGTTADFAAENINAIFTGIAGSYFGDWDTKNNLLRAALASGALSSFWGGIPNWYLHHMSVGESIGYCARYSMNAYYSSFNGSQRLIHVALMGDPTLRFRPIVPSGKLRLTNSVDGILLEWDKVNGDIDGYNLYRINNETLESVKVNDDILTETSYLDLGCPTGQYYYQLRTTKKVLTASANYFALGVGSASEPIDYITSVAYNSNDGFGIAPNPTSGHFRLQLPQDIVSVNKLVIQDLTGRNVLVLDGNFTSERTINTGLPMGTYMLLANTNKGQFVEKIQVVR